MSRFALLIAGVCVSTAGCVPSKPEVISPSAENATTPTNAAIAPSDLADLSADPGSLRINSDEHGCVIDGKQMTFPETLQYLRSNRSEITSVNFQCTDKRSFPGEDAVLQYLRETGVELVVEVPTASPLNAP